LGGGGRGGNLSQTRKDEHRETTPTPAMLKKKNLCKERRGRKRRRNRRGRERSRARDAWGVRSSWKKGVTGKQGEGGDRQSALKFSERGEKEGAGGDDS